MHLFDSRVVTLPVNLNSPATRSSRQVLLFTRGGHPWATLTLFPSHGRPPPQPCNRHGYGPAESPCKSTTIMSLRTFLRALFIKASL
jgi:hypothetical protein